MMLNLSGLGAVLQEFQDTANELLAAAQAAGYTASLSVSGNNPVLNLQGQSILITRTTLDEMGRYGITPEDWVRSKVTGQAPNLTAVARAVSQAEQLAALIAAGRNATSGADVVQADIDQLLAFWQSQGTPYNPALVDVARLNPELNGWVPSIAETQFYTPTLEAENLAVYQSQQPSASTTTTSSTTASSVASSTPSTVSSVLTSALDSVGASDLVSSSTLSSIPTWAWLAAGAAALYFFMGRKK